MLDHSHPVSLSGKFGNQLFHKSSLAGIFTPLTAAIKGFPVLFTASIQPPALRLLHFPCPPGYPEGSCSPAKFRLRLKKKSPVEKKPSHSYTQPSQTCGLYIFFKVHFHDPSSHFHSKGRISGHGFQRRAQNQFQICHGAKGISGQGKDQSFPVYGKIVGVPG